MTGFQYAMLGAGGLALLLGVVIMAVRVRMMVGGKVVDAVVVDEKIETVHSSHDNTMARLSRPVFEFRHDGKTYRSQSSLAQKKRFAKGTKVRVRYMPSDPQGTAEIDSLLVMWGFPLVLFVVAGTLIGVALYQAGQTTRSAQSVDHKRVSSYCLTVS
jgi:hypothetical protein